MDNNTGNPANDSRYELVLYVNATSGPSRAAEQNLVRILEENLPGRYRLEVVDVSADPGVLERQDLVAVPTLVKPAPAPYQKLIGDMSDKDAVLMGLDIG